MGFETALHILRSGLKPYIVDYLFYIIIRSEILLKSSNTSHLFFCSIANVTSVSFIRMNQTFIFYSFF